MSNLASDIQNLVFNVEEENISKPQTINTIVERRVDLVYPSFLFFVANSQNFSKQGHSFVTDIIVSGNHWSLPVYVNLNKNESFLVMNDSFTNKTSGYLYNYLESPTLEWNSSEPVIREVDHENVTIGYNGNETLGLNENALFKSTVFLQNYSSDVWGGGISFSPNSSYLTYLQKQKIIQDKIFSFNPNYSTTFVDTFNLTIGSLPEKRTNLHWVKSANPHETWEISGVYIALNREYVESCQGTIYFNDTTSIQVSSDTLQRLGQELEQFSNPDSSTSYKCGEEVLEKYPVLSIYTEDMAFNIPARSYIDLRQQMKINDTLYCPLLVKGTGNLNYCAVLGYNFFGFHFLAFSQDKQAVGFDLNEVTLLTMIDNKFEIIAGAFALIMSIIFVIIGMNYYEKNAKLIERETANYEVQHQRNSFSDSVDELSF